MRGAAASLALRPGQALGARGVSAPAPAPFQKAAAPLTACNAANAPHEADARSPTSHPPSADGRLAQRPQAGPSDRSTSGGGAGGSAASTPTKRTRDGTPAGTPTKAARPASAGAGASAPAASAAADALRGVPDDVAAAAATLVTAASVRGLPTRLLRRARRGRGELAGGLPRVALEGPRVPLRVMGRVAARLKTCGVRCHVPCCHVLQIASDQVLTHGAVAALTGPDCNLRACCGAAGWRGPAGAAVAAAQERHLGLPVLPGVPAAPGCAASPACPWPHPQARTACKLRCAA